MSTEECTSNDENCKLGDQQPWVESSTSAAIFLGAVCGQISMGYVGDLMTRSQALLITLIVACFGSVMCAVAPAGEPTSIYAVLVVFRFVTGYGLGGIYPLSASKSAEDGGGGVAGKINSVASSWAFFWQMPGIIFPWLVAYLITYDESLSVSGRWRFVLGFGAIPLFLAICGLVVEKRLFGDCATTVVATAARECSTITDISSITMSTISNSGGDPYMNYSFWDHIKDGHNLRNLLGSGLVWFLFDIVVYGINLLGGVIISGFSDDDNVSATSSIRRITGQQLTALSLGIPAVILSIYLLPYVGLKWLATGGFGSMVLILVVMAGLYTTLQQAGDDRGLFAMYCILCFCIQFGTAVATFSLPASLFPFQIRARFNGVAAAMGKMGAFIGAAALGSIANSAGIAVMLGVAALVAFGGFLVGLFVVDSRNIDSVEGQGTLSVSLGISKLPLASAEGQKYNNSDSLSDIEARHTEMTNKASVSD